jgi:hypothetical protein
MAKSPLNLLLGAGQALSQEEDSQQPAKSAMVGV